MIQNQEMEEEFLVTKTVSSKEAWEDFESWIPSFEAEYNQLVRTKEAVEQVAKRELHTPTWKIQVTRYRDPG